MKPITLDDPSYTLAAVVRGTECHVPLYTFLGSKWYTGDGAVSPRELTSPYVRVHDPSVTRVELPRPMRVVEGVHGPTGPGNYIVAWERDAGGQWAWEDERGHYPCYVSWLHEPEFVEFRSTDDIAPPQPLADDQLRRVATALNPKGDEVEIAEAVAILREVWDRMEADRAARLARRLDR